MGIEDIPNVVRLGKKLGKADEVADAAKVAKVASKAVDTTAEVVVEMQGVAYRFPPGTDPVVARRLVWTKIMRSQLQGKEEKIILPSKLPEPKWDAEKGMGAVPMQSPEDFKYNQGFVREMTPREFFENAPGSVRKIKENSTTRYQSLEEGYREGKSLSPPYLVVRWNDKGKHWEMQSHEGRHRAALIESYYGDMTKMPVQIHPRKPDGTRFKEGEITDDMRKAPIVGVAAAAVIPEQKKEPKKLEPGVYLDEDSGKYYRINKDGSMESLDNETP